MRNEQPPVKVVTMTWDQVHAMPEVTVTELVMHSVYLLQGRQKIATLNYMGRFLDAGRIVYHFHGPRNNLNIYLRERPGGSGTLEDGRGIKITVRKFTGPD